MAPLLLAVSVLPVASAAAAATPLEALDSVFVVSTVDGQGAAFLVTDRMLITAAHVVEGSRSVRLEGTQDPPVRTTATVLYRDSIEDVAVLVVAEPLDQVPLALQDQQVEIGDEVFAAGSPIDGVVISRGRITEVNTADGIVSTTPVDPGNSGGPLLNGSGAVVGMVYAQGIPDGNAYSVPTNVLRIALTSAEEQPPPDADSDVPGTASVTTSMLVIAALAVAIIALAIAILALIFALTSRERRRNSAPPITITLNEE